jgi:hypothetical protein
MPATFLGMCKWRVQLDIQVTACLGNDLDAALNEPLALPVGLKGIEQHVSDYRTNALDRFNNVCKTEDG